MLQQTLVLLKPDTVYRGLIGEIIGHFERIGLRVAAIKMASPDKDFYHHHYETIGQMITRRGQKAFDTTIELMLSTPVVAMVLEGVEAVEVVRKVVGGTEPKTSPLGTIRGDYAHMSFDHANSKSVGVPNLVHASGNAAEAEDEIRHRFAETEIFHYETGHSRFVR